MTNIKHLYAGDILAFNDPQTPWEILNSRNNGVRYPNHILVFEAPDDMDLDDLAKRRIIDDHTVIGHGLDEHGCFQEVTLGEWISDDFNVVGHKNTDDVLNSIFADVKTKED